MKRSPVNTNNDTGVIRLQGQPFENISVLNINYFKVHIIHNTVKTLHPK